MTTPSRDWQASGDSSTRQFLIQTLETLLGVHKWNSKARLLKQDEMDQLDQQIRALTLQLIDNVEEALKERADG